MSRPPFSSDGQPIAARRQAAQRFLDERIDYERIEAVRYEARVFKLDRVRELFRRLGSPHLKVPVVHVAGTKGKGSTVAMIGAMLSAAGYRTGRFTSPHLDTIEERMAVDGQPCPAGELVELVDRLRPVVAAMDEVAAAGDPRAQGPTYFEIATAMAIMHFVRCRVDVAVLEVGLGGRLDSTNVCRPLVSAITSISYDHTRQLGNTLESIAREKAGIIKSGVPVVSGVAEAAPREVIRGVCRRRGCRLAELGVDFEFDYRPPRGLESGAGKGSLDFHDRRGGRQGSYQRLGLPLLGRHQASNAAVALAALGELRQTGWKIGEEAVRSGLASVVWPVRLELLARRPAVVCDAAHNLASVDALLQVLRESFSVRRRLLVFGTTREKDARGMLQRLLPRFDEVIFTLYVDNPRAVPPEELRAIAAEQTGRRYRVCAGPTDAWKAVRSLAAAEDLICVTGSFFLAAEMRRQILTRPLTYPAQGAASQSSQGKTVQALER